MTQKCTITKESAQKNTAVESRPLRKDFEKLNISWAFFIL